jgi:hypothetical protein
VDGALRVEGMRFRFGDQRDRPQLAAGQRPVEVVAEALDELLGVDPRRIAAEIRAGASSVGQPGVDAGEGAGVLRRLAQPVGSGRRRRGAGAQQQERRQRLQVVARPVAELVQQQAALLLRPHELPTRALFPEEGSVQRLDHPRHRGAYRHEQQQGDAVPRVVD